MKTLLLLRHAKSREKETSVPDKMRPLSDRGKYDSYKMAKFLKNNKLIPSLIISSSAKRAKDTSNLLAESIGYDKNIHLSELLYGTDANHYIRVISEIADNIDILLLVGHNPILENLIELITNELIIMETCSLVHILLPITTWREIKTNPNGELIKLVTIKDLTFQDTRL
jgi:phosphohistidine phosphatase